MHEHKRAATPFKNALIYFPAEGSMNEPFPCSFNPSLHWCRLKIGCWLGSICMHVTDWLLSHSRWMQGAIVWVRNLQLWKGDEEKSNHSPQLQRGRIICCSSVAPDKSSPDRWSLDSTVAKVWCELTTGIRLCHQYIFKAFVPWNAPFLYFIKLYFSVCTLP